MYSKQSQSKLNTCHPLLIDIFTEVSKTFDHTILEGTRDEETQNKYFQQGLTQVKYPNSKHNSNPSMAVDAVPYPINWNDKYRLAIFIGYVLATAHPILEATPYKLVSGIDWDADTFTKDHSFLDFPHFQLELK
jgi:peptidoglycan L-alanyl-D-glutamate endopeptidase CwlK